MSQQEVAQLNAREAEVAEQARLQITGMAQQLGYEPNTSIEELGLSAEQIAQVRTSAVRTPDLFFAANRIDGKVCVAASSMPTSRDSGKIDAHIFSPAFYNGCMHNSDFSVAEMRGNLENALKLPSYPKRP